MVKKEIMAAIFKQLIEAVLSAGFDIDYRKTRLADAYVDYDKGEIVVGDNQDISLLHECLHVLYDEVLDEHLSERNVEKSAQKIAHLQQKRNCKKETYGDTI